ncbi:interleukin-like EMT inducer domain-containing protein [Teredinibacter franksiae]|uniref:interleukin-like EMT inducer domain-containing protein n=1 Tax=Teredinibacter franksiae TaxID=2761453 RepID=UPI00162A1484|nr:interleukin-like EMT inducer domain-containing protein [Teredinibacter franksiae]
MMASNATEKTQRVSLVAALSIVVALLAVAIVALVLRELLSSPDASVVIEEGGGRYTGHAYVDRTLKLSRTVYNGSEIKLKIGHVIYNNHIRLNVPGAKEYSVSFFNNKDFIESTKFTAHKNTFKVTEFGYLLEVPERVRALGFDEVIVRPNFQFDLKVSFDESDQVNIDRGSKRVTIPQFISELPKDYVAIFSIKDEGTRHLSDEHRDQLAKMGSKIKDIRYRGSWAAIWQNNRPLAEDIGLPKKMAEIDGASVAALKPLLKEKGVKLLVQSAGFQAGNVSRIVMNEKDLSRDRRGINIVVLDNHLNTVASLTADTYSKETFSVPKSLKLHASSYERISLGEVMASVPKDFYTLLVSKGQYVRALSEGSTEYFSALGSTFAQAKSGESYVGVFRAGKVLSEKLGKGGQALSLFEVPEISEAAHKAKMPVSLVSTADERGMAAIYIQGEDAAANSPGVNMVVLSPQFEIISHRSFNTIVSDDHRNITLLESFPQKELKTVAAKSAALTEDKLRFTIKPKHYQQLVALRDEAMSRGGVKDASKKSVPAKLDFQGETYKVDMRFKGDWLDHLDTARWSYRVNMKGAKTLMGMKRFSIQTPGTRSHMFEWIVHEVFRREGGITPRYDFVPVDINNKGFGVYALEEHFGKRLIEFHGRKEGPILKFDESVLFKSADVFDDALEDGGSFDNTIKTLLNSDIDVFQTSKTLEADNLRENYRRGYALLDGFRKKTMKPGDVFDIDAFARFVSVTDIFQSWHALRWHNLRFYYNPIIDRLEPILFDADRRGGSQRLHYFTRNQDEILELMFSDDEFTAKYFARLEKLSDPDYFTEFRNDYADELSHKNKLLSENGGDYKIKWEALSRRQEVIRNTFYGGKPLDAMVYRLRPGKLDLVFENDLDVPFEIRGLRMGSKEYAPARSGATVKAKGKGVRIRFAIGAADLDLSSEPMLIDYRVPGTSKWRELQVLPFKNPLAEVGLNGFVRSPEAVLQRPFIKQPKADVLLIAKGEWTLDEDLIVPESKRLIIESGTRLDLVNQAKIISFSPVTIAGSVAEPIVIHSSDNSSQGLTVLQANKSKVHDGSSVLSFVTFDGLSNPNDDGWMVPGSITFYQSDVLITESVFKNNHCEDALNIVSSDFLLTKVVFENTYGDAFDSDFSTGRVIDSHFIDSGNDSVDFSGSRVLISDVKIDNAGDKGVSAGEASTLTLRNLVVDGAEIGIASKDGSRVVGHAVEIKKSVIGLAAYQKKPEYGKAQIDLKQSTLNSEISLPFIYDEGSSISLNEEPLYMEKKKKELLIAKIAGA